MQKKIAYLMCFLLFVSLAMLQTQMIPYLTKIGYTLEERGVLLSAVAVGAIALQFLFGYLCDRFQTIRKFFMIAYIIMSFSAIAFFQKETLMFYYHFTAIACMGGLQRVLTGLNETWLLGIDQKNYGKLRAAGAFGLTIGAMLAGWIVNQQSFHWLLYCYLGIGIVCLWLIAHTKDIHSTQKPITVQDIKQLCKNKTYLFVCLIYLFVLMIGTADQYVVIDKLLSLSDGQKWVGIKWAVQAAMEIPLFLFSGKIMERFSLRALLKFGIIMYAVKFGLYAWAQTPWFITLASTLQLVTLPLIMVTSKLLIGQTANSTATNSAQMFAIGFFMGGSALITPLITAPLSANIGYDKTLWIVAIFALVPLLCVHFFFQKHKDLHSSIN